MTRTILIEESRQIQQVSFIILNKVNMFSFIVECKYCRRPCGWTSALAPCCHISWRFLWSTCPLFASCFQCCKVRSQQYQKLVPFEMWTSVCKVLHLSVAYAVFDGSPFWYVLLNLKEICAVVLSEYLYYLFCNEPNNCHFGTVQHNPPFLRPCLWLFTEGE